MQPNTFRTIAVLALLVIVLVAFKMGLSKEMIVGAFVIITPILSELGLRTPMSVPAQKPVEPPTPTGPGSTMLILLVALALGGCGKASLPPGTVELVNTVSNAVHTVSQFVDAAQKLAPVVADVPDRITRGQAEIKAGDYVAAAGTFFSLAQEFKSAGVPMPDEVQAAHDYLGMIAAQNIQNFSRAISGKDQDGNPKQ